MSYSDPSYGAPAAESRAGRFARNSIFGSLAGLIAALGSVVGSIIIARCLGVEETGIIAYAVWVAMLAAAIVDLGIQATLARYLPELTAANPEDDAQRLARVMFRPLAVSSVAVLGGFVAYGLWLQKSSSGTEIEGEVWYLVGLTCVLQALAGVAYGYLRGMQRFDLLALLMGISTACQLLGIAVGAMTIGVRGALAGYCVGSALPAAYSLRFAVPRATISARMRKRVRRYAFYAWAGTLASTFVWSRAELFFLQRSTGSAAVGLFSVSVTISNIVVQAPMLLTAGLLPFFAQCFGRQAVAEAKEGYIVATRTLALIAFPACCGMVAILPTALPLIFGHAFATAVPAASLLVLAAGVSATTSAGTSLLLAMDRSDIIFCIGLVLAALAVAAGLTVIPEYGVMGAAWTRAFLQFTGVVIGIGFLFWRHHFPLPFSGLFRILAAAVLSGLLTRISLQVSGSGASLAVGIPVGVITYGVALRAFRAVQPTDAYRVRQLTHSLPVGVRKLCGAVLLLLTTDEKQTRGEDSSRFQND